MPSQRTYTVINIFSIVCATWYIAFGWVWVWLANVIFVFPIALLGLVLWFIGRKAINKKLNKIAGIMLITGTATSFGVALYYLAIGNW
jgi:hypothetical protein